MASETRMAPTEKGRGTREHIVDVAAGLMHMHGVAGTGTSAVRREAEVSSSQIYHYFTDKKDLTRAVVAHQIAAVVGSQSDQLSEVGDLPGLVEWRDQLVELAGTSQGVGGCPIGSLAGELADADEYARAALEEGFAAWQVALRDALARVSAANGSTNGSVVDSLAWALLASIQGGLLLAQTTHSTRALEDGIDAVLAQVTVLRG